QSWFPWLQYQLAAAPLVGWGRGRQSQLLTKNTAQEGRQVAAVLGSAHLSCLSVVDGSQVRLSGRGAVCADARHDGDLHAASAIGVLPDAEIAHNPNQPTAPVDCHDRVVPGQLTSAAEVLNRLTSAPAGPRSQLFTTSSTLAGLRRARDSSPSR